MAARRAAGEVADLRRSWTLPATIAVLVLVNLLNNVLAPAGYLLWSLLAMSALVLLAHADGLRREQWGFGPLTRRTLAVAAGVAAAIAAVMLIGTVMPGIRFGFVDERVAGMTAGEVALAAAVRGPVGTAMLEELAFRGVLLAMLVRRFGTAFGVLASSTAFGLWHLAPAMDLAASNELVGSVFGGWAPALAMVAAGVAGLALCWLRIRHDHLVVPVAAHASATGLGYLLAWLALGP